MRWALLRVRVVLYVPLELLHEWELDAPAWLLRLIVAIDAPLVAVCIPRGPHVDEDRASA
jgi:hypothetical protein